MINARLPELRVGAWVRFQGAEWLVHTIAWNVCDTRRIVGIVQTDTRCGSSPNARWLTVEEATEALYQMRTS